MVLHRSRVNKYDKWYAKNIWTMIQLALVAATRAFYINEYPQRTPAYGSNGGKKKSDQH